MKVFLTEKSSHAILFVIHSLVRQKTEGKALHTALAFLFKLLEDKEIARDFLHHSYLFKDF
jgi:hypothetical protein